MTVAAVFVELGKMPDLVESFGRVGITNAGNRIADYVERSFAKRWWQHFARAIDRLLVETFDVVQHHARSLCPVFTRLALATRAVIKEIVQLTRDLDHAGGLRHYDH